MLGLGIRTPRNTDAETDSKVDRPTACLSQPRVVSKHEREREGGS